MAEKAASTAEQNRFPEAPRWEGSLDDCAVPFPEGVESAVVPALPACWVQFSLAAPDNWITGTGTAHSGTKRFFISWEAPQINDWLISPGVALTGGTAYQLKYWRRAGSTSYSERLDVWAGNTTQDVAGMTLPVAATYTFNSTTYTQDVYAFTPSVNGTYCFGWHGTSLNALGIYLDDIELVLAPQAPAKCCYGDNPCQLLCQDVTQTVCQSLGGTWTDGQSCATSECPRVLDGELCCNAFPIAGLPFLGTGTTAGYTDNYNAVCPTRRPAHRTWPIATLHQLIRR